MNKLVLFGLLFVFFNCQSPQAREPITTKTGSFINTSIVRNKILNAKEKEAIDGFIATQKEAYTVSEYGFWYSHKKKAITGSLKTAGFGDIINYNYGVKSLSGQVIYTTEVLGNQSYNMDREELFSGLREGLKLMKAGETVNFIFPSQKAYGYYGDGKKIPSNTPIICEVTVTSITHN